MIPADRDWIGRLSTPMLYRRQMLRPRDPELADKLTRVVLTHLVLT